MPDPVRPDERSRGLSPSETVRLTEQIAALTGAGLPLGRGLAALGEELPAGSLRSSLMGLSGDLERGEPLEKAVERQQHQIPPHLRGLILGGLQSGRVGDVLGRFSAYLSVGAELERKLRLSLAYPILTIAIALIVFTLVQVLLVTTFATIFRDFGVGLPRLTVLVLLVSRSVGSVWPVILALVLLAAAAWPLARLFMSPAQRRSLATRIPIVGRVWRFISWAEFCHMLALLLECRLPLPDALRLTGTGVRNADLDRACLAMAGEVERGGSLAQAMASRPELPAGLPRLLRWAADQNAVSEILHIVGEMLEARARSQAAFAGTVTTVLAVIFVLWGVFITVVALILPMVQLISVLSG